MNLKEQKITTAEELLKMFFDGTSGETIITTIPTHLKELAKKMILIKTNDAETYARYLKSQYHKNPDDISETN